MFAQNLVYFNEVGKPEKMLNILFSNQWIYQDLVGCKCCIQNHWLIHHNKDNLTLKDNFPHSCLSSQSDLDQSLYSLNMQIGAWKKKVWLSSKTYQRLSRFCQHTVGCLQLQNKTNILRIVSEFCHKFEIYYYSTTWI